jgi:hypothetical protein
MCYHLQELTLDSGTGRRAGLDKTSRTGRDEQDWTRRAGLGETSRTGRDEQDWARRAGLGETIRTGRDEQDRQDDDLDLDLVTPFELETNQSGSGFI